MWPDWLGTKANTESLAYLHVFISPVFSLYHKPLGMDEQHSYDLEIDFEKLAAKSPGLAK